MMLLRFTMLVASFFVITGCGIELPKDDSQTNENEEQTTVTPNGDLEFIVTLPADGENSAFALESMDCPPCNDSGDACCEEEPYVFEDDDCVGDEGCVIDHPSGPIEPAMPYPLPEPISDGHITLECVGKGSVYSDAVDEDDVIVNFEGEIEGRPGMPEYRLPHFVLGLEEIHGESVGYENAGYFVSCRKLKVKVKGLKLGREYRVDGRYHGLSGDNTYTGKTRYFDMRNAAKGVKLVMTKLRPSQGGSVGIDVIFEDDTVKNCGKDMLITNDYSPVVCTATAAYRDGREIALIEEFHGSNRLDAKYKAVVWACEKDADIIKFSCESLRE